MEHIDDFEQLVAFASIANDLSVSLKETTIKKDDAIIVSVNIDNNITNEFMANLGEYLCEALNTRRIIVSPQIDLKTLSTEELLNYRHYIDTLLKDKC